MPRIIPISDLRNKANEVAALCHEGEPIFITRNGMGELVVMSQALYEQMSARLELYEKLEESEVAFQAGRKGKSHAALMKSLRSRIS